MSLREDILNLLEQNQGKFISGQLIANEFSVSRSAVSKCIKALRGEGFVIKSINKLGHCLLQSGDVLSHAQIKAYLGNDDIDIKVYKTIDSTNTQAKRDVTNGAVRDAIYVSNEQTGGRGRSGKSFYSPKSSGLYFSFVLHPKVSLAESVCLTSAAAVAVCDAIENTTKKHPKIKWVNDIFIDNKKICGILTEAVSDFESGNIQAVIVGIGINLTTKIFPEDIKDIASCLGESIDKNQFVADIYKRLREFCSMLPERSFMDAYRAYSLVLGNTVNFNRNGKNYIAEAKDILDDGSLVVLTDEHERIVLQSGEISIKLKA